MTKNNKGITLIALIITITVMIIFVSIGIMQGKKIISNSKVQTIETNMLTVQAKIKSYTEEIEAKIWEEKNKDNARDKEFNNRKMSKTTVDSNFLNQVDNNIKNNYVAYIVSNDALAKMGLDEIKDERYIVIFSKKDYKLMDIIYPEGVKYNNSTYYALSALKDVFENE